MEPVTNPEAAIEFEELLRRAALLQGASGQKRAAQGSGGAATPMAKAKTTCKEEGEIR